MELFDIADGEFEDRETFNSYLTSTYESLSDRDLYIITGLTEYSEDKFFETLYDDGWEELKDYGPIQKVGKQYGDELFAQSYLNYDEDTNLILFYTDQRKTEEIENAIEPFLNNTQGVHYLYISPRVLKDVRERLVENEPGAKLTEFVARRSKRTETPAVHRPDVGRTISYYGDDALETLREHERDYGVLPHIMEVVVPGEMKFRITKQGVFKLLDGSLSKLFEYMEDCIEQSLKIKEAYEETSYKMLNVGGDYEIPSAEPATIKLRNELEYHEIDNVKSSIQEDQYALLDTYAEEGSLFFSGKVYDEVGNVFYNIRANADEIRLFPEEERELGSFFRFYEFVQNNVDEQAVFAET